MKTKIMLRALLAFLLVSTALYAAVGELSWSGRTSWTYNKEISGDKPGDQWDTQKTDQEANPVKWVLAKMGGNPVIWLRIDDTVTGTAPEQLKSDIRTRMESRGIAVNTIEQKTVGGQDVYIVSGLDRAKEFRFSQAVFVRAGTKRAYQIELTAPAKDFSTYQPAFMGMVQTIRLLPVATAKSAY